jgi:hypothetical protein
MAIIALTAGDDGTVLQPNLIFQGTGVSETKFCTTQLDKTSNTTLANITGLTGFTLTAAGVYNVDVALFGTATANGGWKVAFKYTTATLTGLNLAVERLLASSMAFATVTDAADAATNVASTTAILGVRMQGRIVVNAGGTMAIQFAQNASHADTSSIYVGSFARLTRIS